MSRFIGRRDFIAVAAGAIAGYRAGSAIAQSAADTKLGRIGLQLYTLREMMKKSVPRTLASVSKAGYTEVEFAGYLDTPVQQIRKMLDDNGLTSPSAHVSMAAIGQTWEAFLEDASILGQKYLTVAWIDAPERTLDGYKRIADRFNAAGLKARGKGIQLAYHNYSYEFAPVGGRIPYELLLEECDPKNLAMEVDVFWMRQAGSDPLEWFAKFPGRFPMLHAKDMGPPPKRAMVDVGKGVVDWKSIFSHSGQAGLRHVFVEHDDPKEPLESIRTSYRYLRALRFSKG
ncbi:MAG TPA: sugar phosphate isomerase/epimerase [Gemmatimonadaceae bacterium]|nr:sugar phosphate isomerase/epimerase [Gemmatimonadaceae bacterium]